MIGVVFSLPLLSQIVCMPWYVSSYENGAESAAGKQYNSEKLSGWFCP